MLVRAAYYEHNVVIDSNGAKRTWLTWIAPAKVIATALTGSAPKPSIQSTIAI